MRIRDALKLGSLIALYAISVTLAFVLESEIARRVWRLVLLPIAGFLVLLLVVVQIPCEHTRHDPVTVPMRTSSPAPEPSLPFLAGLTPVRQIGDQFDYQQHFGYQVPIRFDFGPSVEWGRIMSSRLALNARMHLPNNQLPGTEAIWVDGILSGTPYRGFLNRDRIRHDLSLTNHTFFERLDTCCRKRVGWAELALEELLAGSSVTEEDVLRDGRVDVVIADDTEVLAAELEICSLVDSLIHCRTAWVTPFESSVQTRALPLR